MPADILTVKATTGQRWRIHNPGGRIGRRLAAGRPYEHKMLEQMRTLGLTGSAFDVGAHVGNHTLYLAIVCGLTVHAFEGAPDRANALKANVGLNLARYPVLAERVMIHPYAAGATKAEGWWADGRYMTLDLTQGAAKRYGDHPRNQDGPVPVKAIDEEVDVTDLALVKIDVEGMEPDVLAGMTKHLKRCKPTIYTETHTEESHDAQAAVLEPLGYRMVGPVVMGSKMERWEC